MLCKILNARLRHRGRVLFSRMLSKTRKTGQRHMMEACENWILYKVQEVSYRHSLALSLAAKIYRSPTFSLPLNLRLPFEVFSCLRLPPCALSPYSGLDARSRQPHLHLHGAVKTRKMTLTHLHPTPKLRDKSSRFLVRQLTLLRTESRSSHHSAQIVSIPRKTA